MALKKNVIFDNLWEIIQKEINEQLSATFLLFFLRKEKMNKTLYVVRKARSELAKICKQAGSQSGKLWPIPDLKNVKDWKLTEKQNEEMKYGKCKR